MSHAIYTPRLAMMLALKEAQHSPDPSTQNGAVLLDPGGYLIAYAHNRFPTGVAYRDDRWERPRKYHFIEHAERNVIFEAANCGHQTRHCTLVAPWAACADCARAIIQVGIEQLVRFRSKAHGHWDQSILDGDTMMREAGVQITELRLEDFHDIPTLRRNGEDWPA